MGQALAILRLARGTEIRPDPCTPSLLLLLLHKVGMHQVCVAAQALQGTAASAGAEAGAAGSTQVLVSA